MTAVAKEVAQSDVEKWLDYKKVRASRREQNKAHVDNLIAAVSDGVLVVNEDKTITQNLSFPVQDKDGKDAFEALEYKPRIATSIVGMHLQGVNQEDNYGRVSAYVAALTGKPKALVMKLDTEDFGVASSIAVFFV